MTFWVNNLRRWQSIQQQCNYNYV